MTPDRRVELARARAAGQVAGAYLFEGPAGAGKRAAAVWFARLLLCERDGDAPCEECRGCRRTRPAAEGAPADLSHPDFKWVEPDGAFILIGQIRSLQRELALVANEGGRRVAVILDAERLRLEAANALLKTLEEPPADATLILVAIASYALPPTVRSRTTRLRFAAEPESQVGAALEAAGLDPDDAWLAAALGGGSVGAATAWADANLDAARELRDGLEAVPRGTASELLDFAEGFRGRGDRARAHVELFLDVHAALARRRVAEAASAGDFDGVERWLARADAGVEARRELVRRNLNPQLIVEDLLLGAEG